ncbi:hypothetical protein ABZ517_05220 [Streptomyces scabiei]|uniref:hypothetical protein n=1 Tax=Streptomyces scabiei TaxID=1930 RepID=UPI0034103643
MADVINLNDHRTAGEPDRGFAACPCGSGWFELRSGTRAGAVCLSEDGTVTGYSGHPYCIECKTPWRPH